MWWISIICSVSLSKVLGIDTEEAESDYLLLIMGWLLGGVIPSLLWGGAASIMYIAAAPFAVLAATLWLPEGSTEEDAINRLGYILWTVTLGSFILAYIVY